MADMPGMRAEVAWTTPPRQRPGVNLITVDQASLETSVAGWDALGATLTRSDDVASDGGWSMQITRDMDPEPAVAFLSDTGAQDVVSDLGGGHLWTGVPATAGEWYTARADARAETAGRLVAVRLTFWDDGPTLLVGILSPLIIDHDDAWTTLRVSGIAPAATTHASLSIFVFDAETGESHYADRAGIIGDGSAWILPGIDPWTRIDETPDPTDAACLRHLTTTRGARMKVAEIETGEATAVFDNRRRVLTPGNPSSPYHPNVKPRRRIRFIAEPAAGGDYPVFTGHIDKIPPGWDLGDGWVELNAVDALALLADDTITYSAFEHTIRTNIAPDHWWRLDEDSGRTAFDSIGSRHGTYSVDPSGGDPLLAFEGGRGNELVGPEPGQQWQVGLFGRAVTLAGFRGGNFPFAVDVWVRLTRPPVPFNPGTNGWLNAALFLRRGIGADSAALLGVAVTWDNDPARHGRPYFFWVDTTLDEIITAPFEGHPTIADGNAHHIRTIVDVNPTTLVPEVTIWVDGIGTITHFAASSFPDDADRPNFHSTLRLAMGDVAAPVGFSGAGVVGHVLYWSGLDRATMGFAPPAGLQPFDYLAAALDPYTGDRTDQRIHRVLDLVGVDPTDRDIETGTATCGPANWRGLGVRDYLARVVSTEQGALFVNPDGRIAFRGRPPNDPPAIVTLAGAPDPLDADVVPYSDVTPDYSLDRLINIAEVATDHPLLPPVRIVADDSVTDYGPSGGPGGVTIETVARSSSQQRSIGAEIVARSDEPRTVITNVVLASRRDDVPAEVSLGLELVDAVDVVTHPPGGSPDTQRSLVERIEQTFDYQARDHTTSLGVTEVVVLPLFAWDTGGQGWDESVWSEP